MEDRAFGGFSSATVIAGNFGMAMNGSHYFEMFRYMTDEMPAKWQRGSRPICAEPRGDAVRGSRRRGARHHGAGPPILYGCSARSRATGMHVTYAGPHGRLDVDELAGRARFAVRKTEISR